MGFLRHILERFFPDGSPQEKWAGPMISFLREARQAPVSVAGRYLPAPVRTALKARNRRLKSRRVADQQVELQRILEQHPDAREVILFVPSLDWERQLFQRPQQMALALAQRGALVLYMQFPTSENAPAFFLVQERLVICQVPIETFWILERPITYVLTWNRKYLLAFERPRPLYDVVDEIEAFPGDYGELRRDHAKLLDSAEIILATSQQLLERVAPSRPDVLYCPNGVDYEHFAVCRQPVVEPPPADLAPVLALQKPLVGYYGALARWFDYELVKQVATGRPDYYFVLIGPDYDRTLLPSGVLALPNVAWLGEKPYPQLPAYLRYFDVATIPFILSDVTHAVSPVKLFEYMAAGKPVVATALRECTQYPGVLVAADAQHFASLIDHALGLKAAPEYLQTLDRIARANTWNARAEQVLAAIERLEAVTGQKVG
jgi:hypothetical protein